MVIVILVKASRFLNCNSGFGQVVEMMISDGTSGFSDPVVDVVGRKQHTEEERYDMASLVAP